MLNPAKSGKMQTEFAAPQDEDKFNRNLTRICIENSSPEKTWRHHRLAPGKFSLNCVCKGRGIRGSERPLVLSGTFSPGIKVRLALQRNFLVRLSRAGITLAAVIFWLESLRGIYEWTRNPPQTPYFLAGIGVGAALMLILFLDLLFDRDRFAEASGFIQQSLDEKQPGLL